MSCGLPWGLSASCPLPDINLSRLSPRLLSEHPSGWVSGPPPLALLIPAVRQPASLQVSMPVCFMSLIPLSGVHVDQAPSVIAFGKGRVAALPGRLLVNEWESPLSSRKRLRTG